MINLTIERTTGADKNFQLLIPKLDNEFREILKTGQDKYDKYNYVQEIPNAIVVYDGENSIAIGCFKKYNDTMVEIKRMFVQPEYRGKGISKMVLSELENWALENGYTTAILETSKYFNTAISLYTKTGYTLIPNYDQYKDLPDSVCFEKKLKINI